MQESIDDPDTGGSGKTLELTTLVLAAIQTVLFSVGTIVPGCITM